MDYHHHARLTIYSREHLARGVVEGRLSLCEAAAEHGLSRQSAAKWVRRYREQGVAGLKDRSSRPHRSPRGTSGERIIEIERLRRQRWTGVRIAHQLGLSHATISRVLRRLKLNRIRDIEPQLPPNRYEHAAPGDMLHLDIIAFTAMYPDQTERSSTHFLAAAVAWYGQLGIAIQRVLTDNGPCYKANSFTRSCGQLGLKHRRTRPYTPRTNGRPNASSRPPSTSGLTLTPSRTQKTEPPHSQPGPTSTTGTDPTPASTNNHPSAEQISMTTTS